MDGPIQACTARPIRGYGRHGRASGLGVVRAFPHRSARGAAAHQLKDEPERYPAPSPGPGGDGALPCPAGPPSARLPVK